MAKIAFYGVKEGKEIGVYKTWAECEKQIKGYSGAVYKKFPIYDEAYDFVYSEKQENIQEDDVTIKQVKIKKIKEEDKLYAYVDGSFNSSDNIAGYGLALIKNNKVIFKDLGAFRGDNYNESRNVFGEIRGALKAVELAIANNFEEITIVYDYLGIEKWSTGEWKAKKDLTKDYATFMQKYMKIINIKFEKVKAHTGVKFNEMADQLAKMAVSM